MVDHRLRRMREVVVGCSPMVDCLSGGAMVEVVHCHCHWYRRAVEDQSASREEIHRHGHCRHRCRCHHHKGHFPWVVSVLLLPMGQMVAVVAVLVVVVVAAVDHGNWSLVASVPVVHDPMALKVVPVDQSCTRLVSMVAMPVHSSG